MTRSPCLSVDKAELLWEALTDSQHSAPYPGRTPVRLEAFVNHEAGSIALG